MNSVNQIAKDSTEKLPKVSKKNRSNSLYVSKNLKVKSNEKKSDKKFTNLSDEELNIINGKKENAINLKNSKNYSEEFNKAKGQRNMRLAKSHILDEFER